MKKHKIILEWSNYVTMNQSCVLLTNKSEDIFYLVLLGEVSTVMRFNETDHVMDWVSNYMNAFSVIDYVDENYIRVFKDIIKTEKQESSQYDLKVFEDNLNEYLKDNELDGDDSIYKDILRNWLYYSDTAYSSIPYFDEDEHIMTLVETNCGQSRVKNFVGRSWKEVFNQNFRDEVFQHAEEDGWENLPLAEEQVKFLKATK